jgi:hypothetical protein
MSVLPPDEADQTPEPADLDDLDDLASAPTTDLPWDADPADVAEQALETGYDDEHDPHG